MIRPIRLRGKVMVVPRASVLMIAAVMAILIVTADTAWAQPVRGLYNWIHGTADAERSFAFYHDVFGLDLVRSTFAPVAPAGAAPERIRPVSEAGSDPLVWDLTNTHGSRFRTVFMRAANTPFGLELSEFLDIPRSQRPASPWDPGASVVIFTVRDLGAVLNRLQARGATVVTPGGAAIDTVWGRAILVRDPDGCLVEVRQASQTAMRAANPGEVIETSIGITVARLSRALEFYQRLLGFTVKQTRAATLAERRVSGLTGGRIAQAIMSVPGAGATVVLSEFTLPTPGPVTATPFAWRFQDVGSPQFQLEVTGLDQLIERTRNAGYRFQSVGAKPIQRPFGRFVFAIDPDGVFVEFVEPEKGPQ